MVGMSERRGMTVASYLTCLSAFGVAMGYWEAVVVYYLRKLLELVPLPEDIDPALVDQIDPTIITIEQTREASTIISNRHFLAISKVSANWKVNLPSICCRCPPSQRQILLLHLPGTELNSQLEVGAIRLGNDHDATCILV